MSEQVNNTEKAINEKANSEPMIRILKKVLQTPSATYDAKSKKAAEADIQDNLTERLDAVRILQQMGKDANSIVPELIEIVKQDDTVLAAEAALALGSAGLTEEQAKEAIPVLITALTKPRKSEKNDNLKCSILEGNIALTLSKIGKPSVSALIPLLSVDQNEEIQIRAMQILNMIGEDAIEAEPHLLLLLNPDNQELEFASAITLLNMKTQQEKTLPILVQSVNKLLIKDTDELSKKKAICAANVISKSYSDQGIYYSDGSRVMRCGRKILTGSCNKICKLC